MTSENRTQTMLELAAERGVQWPLTTERLTLTPFTAQDAPAVWEFLQLEQVNTWTASSFTGPDDVAERWLPQGSQLVVRVGETVIGNCMIQVQDAWSHAEVTEQARHTQAELGWTFHPEHHGRGYATEAVRVLMELSFTQLGLRRVEAQCFADNIPSWRLMERVGLRREGVFVKESLHRTHGWIDGMSYALLAEEYAALGR